MFFGILREGLGYLCPVVRLWRPVWGSPKPTVSDTVGKRKKTGQQKTREGGRENGGQPFPQLYQIRLVLVTFRRLQCVFLGCLPPLRKLARVGGHRRQPVLNPAMHKASDAGHIGPHGMRRCLSFSYRGSCAADPPPRGKKAALFWGVLDVHKTSQIPSKIALGRGRFGGKGREPKKAEHQGEICFLVIFW